MNILIVLSVIIIIIAYFLRKAMKNIAKGGTRKCAGCMVNNCSKRKN